MNIFKPTVADVLVVWPRFSGSSLGRWLFSRMIGWAIPYTGNLHATVQELSPGHAVVRLKERRAVRNHLRSVHAMAIANTLELASGLAVNTAMQADQRGILVGFDLEYMKKSRGSLTAIADFEVPELEMPAQWVCKATLIDEAGDHCAQVTAHWRVDRLPAGVRSASSA